MYMDKKKALFRITMSLSRAMNIVDPYAVTMSGHSQKRLHNYTRMLSDSSKKTNSIELKSYLQ